MKNAASSGFTLIELLIVFVIMGALIGIGFASFNSYGRKQVVEQAAQDLKTGIDTAKFSAVSRVKTVCTPLSAYRFTPCLNASGMTNLCNDPTNLFEIDAICAGAIPPYPTVVSKKRVSNLSVSVTVNQCGNSSYNNNILIFNALTGKSNGTCIIRIQSSDGSTKKKLCVDNAGNTSIKDDFQSC